MILQKVSLEQQGSPMYDRQAAGPMMDKNVDFFSTGILLACKNCSNLSAYWDQLSLDSKNSPMLPIT